MAAPEPGRRLPDAEVADVDAATDSFGVAEPLRHLDEPPGLKARGVLEEDEGATRPLAKPRIELAQHAEQAVCLFPHLTFVMDDETGDAAANRSANSATTARLGSFSTLMPRFRWTTGRYGCGGTNLRTCSSSAGVSAYTSAARPIWAKPEPGQLE